MMRKIFLLLALLLLSNFALCEDEKSYIMGHHYITLEINKNGFAKVTERYYLGFKSEKAIEEFAKLKTRLGQNIKEWANFDKRFSIHIGTFDDIIPNSVRVSFNTVKDYYLEISYALKTKVASVVKEKERMRVFELKKDTFKSFISGGDYVIPEGTFIKIILPKDATIIEEGEFFNYATITKGERPEIFIQGYRALGNMSFRYIIWKSLAPSISISLAIKTLIENAKKPENSVKYLALLGLLAVLLLAFRRKIRKKIKNFVVSHTELEEVSEPTLNF